MCQTSQQPQQHHEAQPSLAPVDLDESHSHSSCSMQDDSFLQDQSCQMHHRRRAAHHTPLQVNAAIIPRLSDSKRKTKAIYLRLPSNENCGLVPYMMALAFLALTAFTVLHGSILFPSVRALTSHAQPSGFSTKPQTIGFVYSSDESSSSVSPPKTLSVVRFDPVSYMTTQQSNYNLERSQLKKSRSFPIVQWDRKRRKVEPLSDYDTSEESDGPPLDEDGPDCVLPQKWQKKSFPTCNALHEQELQGQVTRRSDHKFLLGSGAYRDVWLMEQQADEQVVLKSMHLDQDWDWDALNRHRQDALISERLTASPRFLDIYGACGNSALYEYASGGSLLDAIGAVEWEGGDEDKAAQRNFATWSSSRKMQVAYDTVSALADLHTIDDRPSVAHDDLDVSQFVSVDGGKSYKLSDFNGAHMIRRHRVEKVECSFRPAMVGGKVRSPEEYREQLVTHKIDNYALGNVLFTLLTGRYPFAHNKYSEMTKMVMLGRRPHLEDNYRRSNDPKVQALIEAMEASWNGDPKRRPSAVELKQKLARFVEKEYLL